MKIKKTILFSSLIISTFLIGNILLLSSCSNALNSTGQSEPPITDSNNSQSKPNNPGDNLNSSTINANSISIKGDKSKILPSMLLNNEMKIDISKFNKNYNINLIKNEIFELVSLDDSTGEITIKMIYQESTTNSNRNFIFKFDKLMKIENTSWFSIQVNYNGMQQYTNLNAYQYSNQKKFQSNLSNQNLLNNFYEFANLLAKENIDIVLKNNVNDLPISYLKFESIKSDGWNNSWFTSPTNLDMNYRFENLKIRYFKKNTNNQLIEMFKEYPSNANKKFSIKFCSAADYILNKVSVNENYKEEKTANYYWGDINFNNGIQASLKLSNNAWLNNYETELEGDNSTKYKVVINKNDTEKASINSEKELIVNVQVDILTNYSGDKKSLRRKKLTISNIDKLSNDPFTNQKMIGTKKFYFEQNENKFEANLNTLSSSKDKIINYVKDKNGLIDITEQLDHASKTKLIFSLKNGMQNFFNGKELTKYNLTEGLSDTYYKNDDIYIHEINYKLATEEHFELEYLPKYFYDKIKDAFFVKMHVNINVGDDKFYTSKTPFDIYFTKENDSLNKLKNM